MNCFQKEPDLRKSAKELLKHTWIKSNVNPDVPKSIGSGKEEKKDTKKSEIQRKNSILGSQKNSSIKFRLGSPSSPGLGSSPSGPSIFQKPTIDLKKFQDSDDDEELNWDVDSDDDDKPNKFKTVERKPSTPIKAPEKKEEIKKQESIKLPSKPQSSIMHFTLSKDTLTKFRDSDDEGDDFGDIGNEIFMI